MLLDQYVPASYLGVSRSAFVAKVQSVAQGLGLPAEWLMAVMYVESKLKPWAKNPGSSASGLIQWIDATAQAVHGVSSAQIRAMNGLQQLDLVERYLAGFSGRLTSLWAVYFAVHFPIAVGKSDDYVLYRAGSSAYNVNKALDVDKDGLVTVANVKSWLWSSLPTSARSELASPSAGQAATEPVAVYPKVAWWIWALIGAGLLVGLYIIFSTRLNRLLRT